MENYEMIHRKIKVVLEAESVTPIICIGENWEERKTDRRDFVLFDQLQQALGGLKIADNKKIIVAYEPIWAIGTGLVPSLDQIIEVHDFIRARLISRFGTEIGDAIPLLYGGSVKPDNAETIFKAENVDGALVGGASLKASDFAPIIAALARS